MRKWIKLHRDSDGKEVWVRTDAIIAIEGTVDDNDELDGSLIVLRDAHSMFVSELPNPIMFIIERREEESEDIREVKDGEW